MRRIVTCLAFYSLLLVSPARAATRTVCASGCEFTSIQAAVDAAGPGDTIELGPETFHETVRGGRTIRGAGVDRTIVDGGSSGSVFTNTSILSDMTIQNGSIGVTYDGCRSQSGGSISVDNCLIRDNRVGISTCNVRTTITNTTISGNTQAGVSSTALYDDGGDCRDCGRANDSARLSVNNSVIRDNGIGVYQWLGRPAGYAYSSIANTTISDNRSDGVRATGRSTRVENSTVSGNGRYGLLLNNAANELTTSTVTSNAAGGVVTMYAERVTISHSTIAGNAGPGLLNAISYYPDVFATKNSIVADNPGGNCWDVSYGHNISSDDCETAEPSDIEGTDPLFLPLADNGGTTSTLALGKDSPAIDAGGDDCPPTDQRGVFRPQDGDRDGVATCDIGAFEFEPTTALVSRLIDEVESLHLHRGIENSLLANLNAALLILGGLDGGNDDAAANVLGAFIRQIRAQYGKKIAAGDAGELIEAAEEIMELLSKT